MLPVIVGDPGIQGLSAFDRCVEGHHALFQWGIGVHAMVIKNIYIVQSHPLKALIQTGQQVFPAAPVPVRAIPHCISSLGADDQLVPVGGQFFP